MYKSVPIDLSICLPIHQSVEIVVNINLGKLVKEYTEILFTFFCKFCFKSKCIF